MLQHLLMADNTQMDEFMSEISSSKLLTYTPGYGSVLKDIQVNKIYEVPESVGQMTHTWGSFELQRINQINHKGINNHKYKILFKWSPKPGEVNFNINDKITIIDYVKIQIPGDTTYYLRIIDNYGNIYTNSWNNQTTQELSSDILLEKNEEMLSDQVIEYIKKYKLVCNVAIQSEDIKQIQKIAGMGREKTITYTLENPQKIVEEKYDINSVIKDLIVAFPGCDPWEKADELTKKYKSKLQQLKKDEHIDRDILSECCKQKTNTAKLISRNRDIDDEDVKSLVEMKVSKLRGIEAQIKEVLERCEIRTREVNKLKPLLVKLLNIPEKSATTDFSYDVSDIVVSSLEN